ncbi:hypothetical protein WJX81_006845 [Elliptochloris bilobata]|uniref:Uncharacterized protein n=1 Tax=Elliptochloris bilobata TaxID=381761 RepID=A0AAW1RPB7_9CHLO
MRLLAELKEHHGCVNHVSFSCSGDTLLSGSDDTRVCIWDVDTRQCRAVLDTGHSANIFCVRYMPNTGDSAVATCAGDNQVRVHDVQTGTTTVFRHHHDRVKKLVVDPGNPHVIVSCGEDGVVRQIDRRQAGGAPQALAALKHHLTGNLVEAHSIAAPSHRPWLLAVGGSDPLLRVFDRRVGYSVGPIKRLAQFEPNTRSTTRLDKTISGVAFTRDGSIVAANYMNDCIYTFSMDAVEGAGPLPRSDSACAGRARPDQSYLDAGVEDASVETSEPQRTALTLAQLVALLDADQITLARRQRRTVAETLATTAGRLRSGGDLTEAMRYAMLAMRLAPTLGRAHYQVACTHEAAGRIAPALDAARRASQYCWSEELQALHERLRAARRRVQPPGEDAEGIAAEGRAGVGAWPGASEADGRRVAADGDLEVMDDEGEMEAGQEMEEEEEEEGSDFSPPSEGDLLSSVGWPEEDESDGEEEYGGTRPVRHWGATLLERNPNLEIAGAVFGLLQRHARPRARPPLDWGAFPEAGGGASSESEGEADEQEARWRIVRPNHMPDPPAKPTYLQCFRGADNRRTYKDVAFVGPGDEGVAAGCDSGCMCIWNRRTGVMLAARRADTDIVNVVASHPHAPILASSGIDSSVKLWVPQVGGRRGKRGA